MRPLAWGRRPAAHAAASTPAHSPPAHFYTTAEPDSLLPRSPGIHLTRRPAPLGGGYRRRGDPELRGRPSRRSSSLCGISSAAPTSWRVVRVAPGALRRSTYTPAGPGIRSRTGRCFLAGAGDGVLPVYREACAGHASVGPRRVLRSRSRTSFSFDAYGLSGSPCWSTSVWQMSLVHRQLIRAYVVDLHGYGPGGATRLSGSQLCSQRTFLSCFPYSAPSSQNRHSKRRRNYSKPRAHRRRTSLPAALIKYAADFRGLLITHLPPSPDSSQPQITSQGAGVANQY